MALNFLLATPLSASPFMSEQLWHAVVSACGGSVTFAPQALAELSWLALFARTLGLSIAVCLLAATFIKCSLRTRPWRDAFCSAARAWRWWCLLAAPWLLDVITLSSMTETWVLAQRYSMLFGIAGWLCELISVSAKPPQLQIDQRSSRSSGSVWIAILIYVVAFTAMNWQLYFSLLLPHGDSAMYEEHLWNLLHGKGFRSYLDQGLFLGEHIQVIHVALLPAYVIWPSHLTLELCESLALALGALPVFWMARRHTDSAWVGVALAVAYLCYFPMQYLDIAIDLKTFRPMSLGVPILLFALDQLERRRYRTMWLLLAVTLSAKEDYAIVFGPLGIWLALRQDRSKQSTTDAEQPSVPIARPFRSWAGWLLAVGSVAYVIVVMKIVLPWFRSGEEIHYVSYFSEFGDSAGEVIINMLLNPGMLLSRLVGAHSAWYALAMLAPLGFVPLASPGRLAVGLPLFALLCLNQLTQDQPTPWHHFHAPLVPIVFWAAAAGCGRLRKMKIHGGSFSAARWACCCSIIASVIFGISPMSRQFWDAGSSFHWASIYVPSDRAEAFAEVEKQIPLSARVASTDFIHPRFTHHERSYDYSQYPRAVNNNQPGCPPDTDYLVIDTSHKYSDFKRLEDIPEYQSDPDGWELIANESGGLFIVLKRVRR